MHVVNHRGIDADDLSMQEGSFASYRRAIESGLGIEFDLNLTQDGCFIVLHDRSLSRYTKGQDRRLVRDLSYTDLCAAIGSDHCPTLEQVFDLLRSATAMSALHMKSDMQQPAVMEHVAACFARLQPDFSRFIVFDLKPEAAKYLKKRFPEAQLAPSLAHEFDIERFNEATGGTLFHYNQVKELRSCYDWVWLDEWDRRDRGGRSKKFYEADLFRQLREHGFKIGLVTPELHYSSAGLLGGEAHEDGEPGKLRDRIEEILSLKPDMVCTDHSSSLYRSLRVHQT